MTDIFTYSPSDIKLIIASYEIGGLVSISVSQPQDKFKAVRGIKGNNARVRSLDRSATLLIEVLHTSPTNDILSQIVAKDELTGKGRCSVLLKDISGTSYIYSNSGFINNYPSVTYNNELSTKTWTITLLDTYDMFVGGNSLNRPSLISQAAGFIDKATDYVGSLI